MTEERLTVRENVGALILWVHILVKTRTVVHIGVLKPQLNSVALLQEVFVENLNPVVQELEISLLDLVSINLDMGDLFSLEINMEGRMII